jgi:MFS transporter, DHA1 family, multidrug resistance protein
MMLQRFFLKKGSYWIPVILLFLEIVCWVEVDLYAPAFSEIKKHFCTTDAHMQLTLSANFFGFFVSSLIFGPIADSIGRRPVVLWGSLVFLLGCVLCLMSSHITFFILGRFIQGVGVSAPAIVAIAILVDMYEGEVQAKIMSLVNSAITLVMAGAPVAGVYLTCNHGWLSNFWVITFMAIAGLVLTYFLIPETLPQKKEFSSKILFSSYKEVFQNRTFNEIVIAICTSIAPYWIFIGILPLLFMDALKMPIKTYGYYQGAVVSTFAIGSLIFPLILSRVNAHVMTKYSLWLMGFASIGLTLIPFIKGDHPVLLTGFMCLVSLSYLFPTNILFIKTFELFNDLKGTASAAFLSMRMLITAIFVSVSGYLYNGTFMRVGVLMFILIMVSMPFYIKLLKLIPNQKGFQGKQGGMGH